MLEHVRELRVDRPTRWIEPIVCIVILDRASADDPSQIFTNINTYWSCECILLPALASRTTGTRLGHGEMDDSMLDVCLLALHHRTF